MSPHRVLAIAVLAVVCAQSATADLNFLVMGDWGGADKAPWTTAAEIQTAAGMEKVATEVNATCALALGDNFYSSGIHGDAHDVRFLNTFEHVFTGAALEYPFQFHVVAGNHDHGGNVTAQIAYTDVSRRWSFPQLWYNFVLGGGDEPTVEVVFIDTVVLTGNNDVRDEDGNLLHELPGSQMPGPADRAQADAQLQWLEGVLKASTADYLIVGGHYPMYSICEHGPTAMLLLQVKAMLEQYKVTAYVNGHDHCMEYLNDGSDVDYHNIGSAHSNDPSTAHSSAVPKGSLKFHTMGKLGGFASVKVTAEGLTIIHREGDGSVAYTTPAHKPRN